MKKNTYIQLGLVLVGLSLLFLRSREGFEAFTETKCPEGTTYYGSGRCIDKRTPGTRPICQPGFTYEEGSDLPCVEGNGRTTANACPEGKVIAWTDETYTERKCYNTVPLCPATSTAFDDLGPPIPGDQKLICVPKNAKTYTANLPTNRPLSRDDLVNACKPGDKTIFNPDEGPQSLPICLSMTPPPAPPVTTTPPSAGVQPRDTDSTPNANVTSSASTFREVINSLKPFRPPTAPSSDLEKERKEITSLAKRNLFFAQVALLLVVLAGLCYLVMDRDSANLIALALLLVGIAVGFFLRR